MPYAILRFSKRKAGGVPGADRHNERKKQSYKSNPDIDLNRTKNNYHLVEPGGKYKEAYTRMVKEAGCKVRKDSVVMVETLLTATPEFLKAMSKEQQRQYFERACDFIAGQVGKEHIISAVVHEDETTPHMHLSFCPITEDGKLSAKIIIGDRRRLEKWQDDYHAYMSGFYPELRRGLSSRITHRKHIPTYLYKQAERLETAHDEIVKAVSDIGMFNAGKKRDEALAVLEKHIPDMTKFTAQIQRTDKYISELEKDKERIKGLLAEKTETMGEQLNEARDRVFLMESELRRMKKEQKRYEKVLERIPSEILEKALKRKNRDDLSR